MENSNSISEKVEKTLEKNVSDFEKKSFMTVKQVAEALGISNDTVKNCIRRVMPEKMKNGKTTYLNKEEVACISKELKSNTQVLNHLTYEASSQVKNSTTELEVISNALNAFNALQNLYNQKEAEYKATIENQNKQIENLTPDAESWRAFAESDGSFSATNVAKLLKIKRDDILQFLEIKKYIMRERHDNPKKKGKYQATALGIYSGYVKNYLYTKDNFSCIQFHITPLGMQKIEKAFCNKDFTPEQQKKINALCAAAEKNMKPNCLGLAE